MGDKSDGSPVEVAGQAVVVVVQSLTVGQDVVPADKGAERFVSDAEAGVCRHESSLKVDEGKA
ncbi:hypothetical protein F6X56_08405 [Rhodococcus erythropolis]|uniref:hypothetical protein n=1 Tax=Rhodococcus erythropolis TaxID=1833 RepID=UPI0012441CBF|nr:hypothetical protein [Rhodococcus erythropolis]QEX09716.1 hypothetical protein F6X56_08405 [Rhodococcus erythropolis]